MNYNFNSITKRILPLNVHNILSEFLSDYICTILFNKYYTKYEKKTMKKCISLTYVPHSKFQWGDFTILEICLVVY